MDAQAAFQSSFNEIIPFGQLLLTENVLLIFTPSKGNCQGTFLVCLSLSFPPPGRRTIYLIYDQIEFVQDFYAPSNLLWAELCAHDLDLESSKPPELWGVYLSRNRISAGVIKLNVLASS